MRELREPNSRNESVEANNMAKYILRLISGSDDPTRDFIKFLPTGKMPIKLLNYGSWGTNTLKVICATDSSVGLEMRVSGLLFKGILRIWYNYGTDWFDIEFIKNGKCVKTIEDVDFENIHNIIHTTIECKE